jgi:hypothetical protein
MKTLIRALRIPRRSFVPITPFEFETFELRVRWAAPDRPAPLGVPFRRMNIHLPSSQSNTILKRQNETIAITGGGGSNALIATD